MAFGLIAAAALVLANGFFVATEFALARVRPTQVDEWERRGRPGARSVRHGVEHLDAHLAACQLGITLASLGLGVVGKPAFEELLEPLLGEGAAIGSIGLAAGLAFFVITLLHVVVGELAPKSVEMSRTQGVAWFWRADAGLLWRPSPSSICSTGWGTCCSGRSGFLRPARQVTLAHRDRAAGASA